MDSLGIPQSSIKQNAAALAERVGRLKLNGQLTGYSPLSRLVELEGLSVGIAGKAALWRSLKETGVLGDSPPVDLDALLERAERQRAELEPHRLEAARIALTA